MNSRTTQRSSQSGERSDAWVDERPAPVRKLLRIAVLTIATDAHRRHHPHDPIHDGGRLVPPPEIPERAERIRAAIVDAGLGEIREPDEFGPEPVLRVHTTEYVEFLETAHARWCAATGSPPSAEAVPYACPIRDQPHERRAARHRRARLVLARLRPDPRRHLGSRDGGGRRRAQRVARRRRGRRSRPPYGLCRPPGHHAAADSFAGYCYLNNAAIAAQAWVDRGARGSRSSTSTSTTATARSSCSTTATTCCSSRCTPTRSTTTRTSSGTRREKGWGAGEGYNRNYPLPPGTAWSALRPRARRTRSTRSRKFSPDGLVVSLGVDTAAEDPDSFQLVADDFPRIGAAIGARPPRRRCSCRKAATRSTCSAATSSACCVRSPTNARELRHQSCRIDHWSGRDACGGTACVRGLERDHHRFARLELDPFRLQRPSRVPMNSTWCTSRRRASNHMRPGTDLVDPSARRRRRPAR